MKEEELILCVGGAVSVTTIMNSFVKLGNFLIGLGRAVGSSIRYIRSKKKC